VSEALERWRALRGQYTPREFDPEAAKDLVNVAREFSDLRRRATTTLLGDEADERAYVSRLWTEDWDCDEDSVYDGSGGDTP
jgi:hypothetical protein